MLAAWLSKASQGSLLESPFAREAAAKRPEPLITTTEPVITTTDSGEGAEAQAPYPEA